MRKTVCTLLVVMVATVAGAPAQESAIDAQSRVQTDQEHTRWIDHVMRSIATIKPGMTRKELFGVLAEEGGLSTRTQRRYVYKHCPYIKVDVEFSPVDEIGTGQDATSENPDDKIVKISRPYLEYSITD
jgi:hypothetical protein